MDRCIKCSKRVYAEGRCAKHFIKYKEHLLKMRMAEVRQIKKEIKDAKLGTFKKGGQ